MDLSSFSDLLRRQAPELLPPGSSGAVEIAASALPHGTTIVALKYPGGVLIAGCWALSLRTRPPGHRLTER